MVIRGNSIETIYDNFSSGRYKVLFPVVIIAVMTDPTNIEAGYNLAYTYIILGNCIKAREETIIVQQQDRGSRIGGLISAKCRFTSQQGSILYLR
jgi:hypothetical protein